MQEKREETNNLQATENKTTDERKDWKTPKLKILPVPLKTQSGPFKDVVETAFYDEPSA